jgi:hypothetical protein
VATVTAPKYANRDFIPVHINGDPRVKGDRIVGERTEPGGFLLMVLGPSGPRCYGRCLPTYLPRARIAPRAIGASPPPSRT